MENSFSMLTLFTGDIMTLCVSVVLLIFSVLSWAVIIEKFRLWRMAKKNPVKIKPNDNLNVIVDRLVRPFDKNLWFLSMVAYISPFIGLFGTVWGVMDSFASIGVNQSVSIGVIAPGLAVALGTTALGLIAAVPAAIAHQYFAKRADDLYERLDDTRREMQSKNKDKK
ncbi:MAG: MotA/TolQ/ExbB proton channel family protein [Alphaproteobacteria bacterium]|nr:MotA/TolQ/ExbB proton channel family protein [Alphaproteobacteria bacterium]